MRGHGEAEHGSTDGDFKSMSRAKDGSNDFAYSLGLVNGRGRFIKALQKGRP
jgi:hypothetical protein